MNIKINPILFISLIIIATLVVFYAGISFQENSILISDTTCYPQAEYLTWRFDINFVELKHKDCQEIQWLNNLVRGIE